jgi:hypothetical protein
VGSGELFEIFLPVTILVFQLMIGWMRKIILLGGILVLFLQIWYVNSLHTCDMLSAHVGEDNWKCLVFVMLSAHVGEDN